MNLVCVLGLLLLHGFHWLYVESKCCVLLNALQHQSSQKKEKKTSPLAALPPKPLLKGWENPARHRIWLDSHGT